VTAENSRADMDLSSVDRVSSFPFRNMTSTFDSKMIHNRRPSPTNYHLRVQAWTDSRPSPCEIPCSQHHPLICVFLPSPADPSLHNSESISKSLSLVS
jgi:hypothetical protein